MEGHLRSSYASVTLRDFSSLPLANGQSGDPDKPPPLLRPWRVELTWKSHSRALSQYQETEPHNRTLAPDFFAASLSSPVQAITGGRLGTEPRGAEPAYPCRMVGHAGLTADPCSRRRRRRRPGRSAAVSCCHCATALSGADCWWVCCAAPTSPPWMPTATRTPSSACECEAGGRVGSGGSSKRLHGLPLWGHTETNLIPPSFLHPNAGKKSKYKTSVRKKTLNPEFNEVGPPREGSPGCWGRGSASRLTVQAPAALGHSPESVPDAVD